MKWAKWMLVAVAVAVGMLFASVVWGAKVDHAAGNASSMRECVSESGRIKNLEKQLNRVENRLETYRRRQDSMLAEMDATWTNRFQLLDSELEARHSATLTKEINHLQKESRVSITNALALRKQVFFWVTLVFGAIVIASFVGVLIVVRKNNSEAHIALYCFEVALMVGVLALIGAGAFHLADRIIDLGAKGGNVQNITSPEANQAVLQAYEQLSNELGRWGALLGVLGTFFGLVFPVGAYLLQIKSVNREGEKILASTKNFIHGQQLDFAKKMQEMVDEKTCDLDAKVKAKVDEIWLEYARLQSDVTIKSFNLLTMAEADSNNKKSQIILFLHWIFDVSSVLQSLTRICDNKVQKTILKDLILEFKEAKKNKHLAALEKALIPAFRKASCAINIDVSSLEQQCPNEMRELKPFLLVCGLLRKEQD